MKKIILFICMLSTLLASTSIKIYAKDASMSEIDVDVNQSIPLQVEAVIQKEEITPFYIPCPVGPGKCKMHIEARAIMYRGTYENPGSLITNAGKFYRCSQCGRGLAAEYSPVIHGKLGHYIFDSKHYTGSQLVVSYGYDGIVSGYPSGTLWSGFEWMD